LIYFVQGQRSGLIKIGYSTSIKARLRTLRTASPEPLEVLAIVEGTKDDERALHERFRFARSHGEWFHPRRRLLEHVESLVESRPATGAEFAARRRRRRLQEIERTRINTVRAAAEEAGMNVHDFIHSRILAPSDS